MASGSNDIKHAALWLIGPDMPGLLRIGSKFVAERGGNIDKDIADKFGEKAVLFMSITAPPPDIAQMALDTDKLKRETRCGVVFQPMSEPTIPDGFQDQLHGFDIVTEDRPGIIVQLTGLLEKFGMLIVGHTGERRRVPGPRRVYEGGQKFVVMLPPDFDHMEFSRDINAFAKTHNGKLVTPLQAVPGLLWWW